MKLIKEITGHVSNAVEKYEITSDQQRMELSSIIQGEEDVVEECKVEENVVEMVKSEPITVKMSDGNGKVEANSIENVIQSVVQSTANRKCRLTIHVDFL